MLKADASQATLHYDTKHDVLYIQLATPPKPSYSIGNPAQAPGVEWLVAEANPDRVTAVIVMDWRRAWVDRHRIPPLPVPVDWPTDDREANDELRREGEKP